MKFLEGLLGGIDEVIIAPTGDGSLGQWMTETENRVLNQWLDEIERREGQYGKPLTDEQREVILERDEWRCVVPHCRAPTTQLNVHHMVWQNFNGANQPENLVTLCIEHHKDAHPGLEEAWQNYRTGDKTAFKKYLGNNKRWKYQPVSRVIDVAFGIVWERNIRWERDDLDKLFPK